jgi:hypothetical protein
MEDIVTLFKLLFFLKTTLLTPSPINIGDEWVSITPNEPIVAITGGAAIYIDVTHHLAQIETKIASDVFHDGSIKAKLIQKDGSELLLQNSGTSLGKDTIWLIITREASISTDVEYVEVQLKSSIPIEAAKVYWKNGKH